MNLQFINLKEQHKELKVEINKRIQNVMDHGQYIMGPEVKELEKKLSSFTRSKYCISVASGTDALLISLMSLGIGPGDEIITTPFSFISTAEVIVLLGAKPVFCDICPDTCNIDASLISSKITQKTKAIIPVSLYGQPANMDKINRIAKEFGNIPVIEDAAQSFGAKYKSLRSCNLSTIGCTSFFPSKPLGCYGDGGAIFTNDENIANICKEIRVHGQSERYKHTRIGIGGRMDTLQCAIVLAKLTRFNWEIKKRLKIGNIYNQLIDQLGLKRIIQKKDRQSVFAQYTVMVNDRDSVKDELAQRGIPTAVHYPNPINKQPAYNHLCCVDCTPVSNELSKKVISLPMGPYLNLKDQQYIVETLKQLKIK